MALLNEIKQSPGRCHHNVNATLQCTNLTCLPNASVNHGSPACRVAAVHGEALSDLHRQLACWCKN
jgi:hypothetical protein